jgi:hypothetical protein
MVNSQDELTLGRSRAVNPQLREFRKPVAGSGDRDHSVLMVRATVGCFGVRRLAAAFL